MGLFDKNENYSKINSIKVYDTELDMLYSKSVGPKFKFKNKYGFTNNQDPTAVAEFISEKNGMKKVKIDEIKDGLSLWNFIWSIVCTFGFYLLIIFLYNGFLKDPNSSPSRRSGIYHLIMGIIDNLGGYYAIGGFLILTLGGVVWYFWTESKKKYPVTIWSK
jgi:hypothetical protein